LVYNNKIDINTNVNLLKTLDINRGRGNYIIPFEKAVEHHFHILMKFEYTKERKIFNSVTQILEKIFKQFLPNVDSLDMKFNNDTKNVSYSRAYISEYLNEILPRTVEKNGTNFDIEISLYFENLLPENYIMLIYSTDLEEDVKIKLNRENYFGYYNLNILSLFVKDVNINRESKMTKATIILLTELVKTEDYYNTIGEYRLIWENICFKNWYSKEGLTDLAKDLHLTYNKTDDLCKIIGDKVNNLSWNDFDDA
jgi:hypothetical protein